MSVVVVSVRKGGMETTMNPDEETWYELLRRYGLYFWGPLQLLVFLVGIFIPPYWHDANAKVTQRFALSNFLSNTYRQYVLLKAFSKA